MERQWNTRALSRIQQLLATHNFDVICIQESFLIPDNYCPTGYHSVRSDRPITTGGLITFIRSGLICTEARRPADMECQGRQRQNVVGNDHRYQRPIRHTTPYLIPFDHSIDNNYYLYYGFDDLFQQNNTVIVGDMYARRFAGVKSNWRRSADGQRSTT